MGYKKFDLTFFLKIRFDQNSSLGLLVFVRRFHVRVKIELLLLFVWSFSILRPIHFKWYAIKLKLESYVICSERCPVVNTLDHTKSAFFRNLDALSAFKRPSFVEYIELTTVSWSFYFGCNDIFTFFGLSRIMLNDDSVMLTFFI